MSVIRNVTTTTTPDELQVRDNQDHKRVYDPNLYALLEQVLNELVNIKTELINIKEGE